ALSRLALDRGGPRDVAALRAGLGLGPAIQALLTAPGLAPVPEGVARAARALGDHGALVAELARALAPDLPLLARDGGFIADGYDRELDEQRTLRDDSRKLIAALQARYAQETGVASLKIRDRKSTRLNSSHVKISYAVFCL